MYPMEDEMVMALHPQYYPDAHSFAVSRMFLQIIGGAPLGFGVR